MARKKATAAARNAAAFKLPRTHAILSHGLASIFSDLHLSAALRDGSSWYPIHKVPNMVDVEIAHGVEERRYAYNERCMAKLQGRSSLLLGEHAGFYDLFARVGDTNRTWGVLVAGPFAIARPTSTDILRRWRLLTGSHGRASDSDFRHYVSMTLAAMTFQGADLDVFRRCVACFAMILSESADVDALVLESAALRERLNHARLAERMWEVVRALVDEQPRGGFNQWRARENECIEMGTTRVPSDVVVGLLVGRENEADPVDDLLRRDAFQRASVDFAQQRGGVLSGRIGDHGVALLVDASGPGTRQRARLTDVGDRVRVLARSFGLTLHIGISSKDRDAGLPARYQSALSAAESALSRGLSLVHAELGPRPTRTLLSELRRQLSDAVGESPALLSPRFDRYLEAVAVRCSYQLDPLRAHLEAGFDALSDALRGARALDEKSLADLEDSLERRAAEANTVRELTETYRRLISDVELAIQRPRNAGQDRSLRRAIAYIRDHLAENLSLGRVARVAGFAPGYFSKLFAKSEGMTFQHYVRQLRIERAKHMLTATELTVEQVGRLAGFAGRSRFHVAFRESVGIPPLDYRRRNPPASVHLPVPKSRLRLSHRKNTK